MRIDILTRDLPHPDAARERTLHRLRFALGRFTRKIARVHATLEDMNGPRGGADKRCRLRLVMTSGGEPLVVEGVDQEISVAIDLAANRLSRTVARRLSRRVRALRNPAAP